MEKEKEKEKGEKSCCVCVVGCLRDQVKGLPS
jgi:hypothetical protein